MEKLNFDTVVQILPNAELSQYVGEIGLIKGIQEENGIVYGYAVKLQKREKLICFSSNEVKEIMNDEKTNCKINDK